MTTSHTANNFKQGYTETYNYYNFSDRVDYNINDSWRAYGRIGRYHTTDISPNVTPNNSALYVPDRYSASGTQVSGDARLDGESTHGGEFPRRLAQAHRRLCFRQPRGEGWGKHLAGQPWYQDYQAASPGVPVYFPQLNIGGTGFGGRGFYWDQRPEGQAYNAKISQQRGSHYLKAGIEHRRGYGVTFVGNTSNFFFPTELTAETFTSPDIKHNGFGFATFLLGGLDGQSQMIGGPAPDPHDEFWGMFIQDDWKVNRWLTLNLGLRNEYETGVARSGPQHVPGSRSVRAHS